tara:strand:- start:1366 stop:2601 length:1236 start_codon:yes stop_codon:yes gene_type:complete
MEEDIKMAKKKKNIGQYLLDFFSSFLLAVICLVLLGLLVWFSTLEMQDIGLSRALEKYYSHKTVFVMPEINGGKMIYLPLPGAYWVCCVLFVNMSLGGILRLRKGWRNIGVVISHMGIASLLLVGFVDHHESIHGKMEAFQGAKYDYATKFDYSSIEVSEFTAEGEKKRPYVIKHEMIKDLGDKMRRFTFKDLPFDLEVRHFRENVAVLNAANKVRGNKSGEIIDGFFLHPAEFDAKMDYFNYGCYLLVKPKNGEPDRKLLMCRSIGFPQTFDVDGKLYGIEMPNEIWNMPFSVDLINSVGEYYPGTQKASKFQSTIAWTGDDDEQDRIQTIKMNHPMRYKGFTLYQASWNEPVNGLEYSGFEIVTNPADQWPKVCLWISAIGLCFHFALKLSKYLGRETRKEKGNKQSDE